MTDATNATDDEWARKRPIDRIPARNEGDWTDDELARAAYADGGGVRKTATARTGEQWRLAGEHRINNRTGPLRIEDPITDETEPLRAVRWERQEWVRDNGVTMRLTPSGYLAVTESYTRGAHTVGHGLVYCGPYQVVERDQDYPRRPSKVLPVKGAWQHAGGAGGR